MTATAPANAVVTPVTTADGPSRRHGTLIAFLVLAATVPWRSGALYAGGVDPVVLAKAALSGFALGAVLLARQTQLRPPPVSAAPIGLLAAFLATTMFGAYVSGLTIVSGVIVARVVILATVGFLYVRAFGPEVALRYWLSAMATVAVLAAVTGLPSLATGRLRGGIPAVHPNELATLCLFPALALVWLFVTERARLFHIVLLLTLIVITWATASRTALGALLVGVTIIVASVRRPRPAQFIALTFGVAVFLYIAIGTDLLARVFLRGGREELTGLASRSIGWSAALRYTDDPWRRWTGSGIGKREIEVRGQYWQTQVLDSSWISAYVQTGRTGVILLLCWIGWLVWAVRLISPPNRVLAMAMLTVIVVRSVTESGLVDSTSDFVTFWLLTLSCAAASAQRWQRRSAPRQYAR